MLLLNLQHTHTHIQSVKVPKVSMVMFGNLGNSVGFLDDLDHAHHVASGDAAVGNDVEIKTLRLPELCVRVRVGVCVGEDVRV